MPPDPEHSANKPPADDAGTPILSWSLLLARWTSFAQVAIALPADAEGKAWRASVESIIALQAVTFALGDLMLLAPGERPLAIDRAGVLIATHRRTLTTTWRGQDMPANVREIIDDAARAHGVAKTLLSRR